MSEGLQLRRYGPASLPALIYLPGLHGDWTLVGGFRHALAERLHFVELTYPRTLTWSLDDYAAAIEAALREQGIARGWVLGESFGSQVVWPLVARKRFQITGVILAGGFVRHPVRWAVRMAERLAGGVSLSLLTRVLFGYARISRLRFRHSPQLLHDIEEFLARRTELDRQAAKHRLRLIAQSDHCAVAQSARTPIYALTGLFDPIVPWWWSRRWLRRHCPQLREYKIIWHADHTVLATASQTAADQVVNWIKNQEQKESQQSSSSSSCNV